MSDKLNRQRLAFLNDALPMGTPVRVLDIGANPLIEGDVSYKNLLSSGLAEVYGFEPQAEALQALNERKSKFETYSPHALGDGTQKDLHLYRSQGFTSIFKADQDSAAYLGFGKGTEITGVAKLETKQLDLLDEIPQPDFLKIDVQGSETLILQHGRAKLSAACAVQTEIRMFPIYKDEPRYGTLENELVTQGFEFLRFASMKHVSLSRKYKKHLKRHQFAQAVDGDAFFIRDLRNIDSYSDETLCKLAIIADSIVENADLTLFTLEKLEARGVVANGTAQEYFTLLPDNRLRSQ